MYYVYILETKSKEYVYAGLTSDLERRLREHKNGKVDTTKCRLPVRLIYFEGYIDKRDAEGREKFLKSGSGKRYLKKQLAHYYSKG